MVLKRLGFCCNAKVRCVLAGLPEYERRVSLDSSTGSNSPWYPQIVTSTSIHYYLYLSWDLVSCWREWQGYFEFIWIWMAGVHQVQMEPHEGPHQYYQRIFIFSLRFPSLPLGIPSSNVLAIKEAIKHSLLRCSLPQALDFLHTQLLAGICLANAVRESPKKICAKECREICHKI